MVFTSLNHYLDLEWLKYAYVLTRKDGAAGIDGQTAQDYEVNLEENLRDLLNRMKSGSYSAPPVRRASIPKSDGTMRPLGIPTFEDKVAQRAIVLLLEPIYEQDFLPCSFGFRPGRSAHQALRCLRASITKDRLRWILDVDLRKFFDTINHQHLRVFLSRRVVDGVLRRMIDRWLKAGVLEGEQLRRTELGTPQGGVISPLLANIYLHCVVDEWFAREVQPRMRGGSTMVRFADDFVLGFETIFDAKRVFSVLGKRVGRFGLTLHPEKTRLVDFRFSSSRGVGHRDGAERATSFDFLGFTHLLVESRGGRIIVLQRTMKARYARALRAVYEWCKLHRHDPLPEQHVRLSQMMRGHFAYYGISGNSLRLNWYAQKVQEIWFKWMARRSGKNPLRWSGFRAILRRFPLPPPKIVHNYSKTTSESAS